MTTPREAIIWCEDAHAPFVAALARALALRVTAFGTPAGEANPFPDAARITDIRHEIVSRDADVALLTTARASGDAPPQGDLLADTAHLRDARKRIRAILTTQPTPASVHDASLLSENERTPARFLPRFTSLASYRDARDTLETFESVRSMSVSSRCGESHISLGALLLDAMLTVHATLGVPERIDASVVTPQQTAGVHRAAPEAIGALAGDLTANLRFASPRSASVTLSDRAGRWFRGVALVGSHGCVRVDDDAFERIDMDGNTADETSTRPERFADEADPAVRVTAREIEDALDPRIQTPPPQDMREVLAMCHAAILSARTGEPESPSTIQRLAAHA